MKKLKTILVVLTMCIFWLISCEKAEIQDKNVVYIDRVNNFENYVFVDMQKSNATADKMRALRAAIKDLTGVSLKAEAAYKNNQYEILVGATNREESLEAERNLGPFDYLIQHKNNKIVIAGGSQESLSKAIELFIGECVDSEEKTLYVPEEYIYKHVYPGKGVTLEGAAIESFKIINNTVISDEQLSKELLSIFGSEFDFEKEITEGEHYIIFDASSYKYEDYSISVEDGNLHLFGSARSISGAIEALSENYFSNLGKDRNLTEANTLKGSIEKKNIYSKEELMAVLTKVYNDSEHIIIGEQSRGQSVTCIPDAIAAFEGATGEKPGIIGVDLQVFGMGILSHNERYEISNILCDIVDYVSDGGIVEFSAHWSNPSGNYPDEENLYRGVLGYDYTKAGFEKAFTDLLTEGTEYNTKWMEEINREVEIFLALKENGVPAIWRPLHEANGNWFWFCTTQYSVTLDASYIKNIWYYLYDHFEKNGIDNLLWCYAPNRSDNYDDTPSSRMSTVYLYPGDKYCDIVGCDWYTEGNLELIEGGYAELISASKKIGAITEFGATGAAANENGKADPELYSSMNAHRDLLTLKTEGYSFAYLMTWGGSWGFRFMGEGEQFMEEEMTLGLSEVKELFDKLG